MQDAQANSDWLAMHLCLDLCELLLSSGGSVWMQVLACPLSQRLADGLQHASTSVSGLPTAVEGVVDQQAGYALLQKVLGLIGTLAGGSPAHQDALRESGCLELLMRVRTVLPKCGIMQCIRARLVIAQTSLPASISKHQPQKCPEQ